MNQRIHHDAHDVCAKDDCPCGITPLSKLIDQRRALAARVAGKDLEIAMVLGDRESAHRALKEMTAQVEARLAMREDLNG